MKVCYALGSLHEIIVSFLFKKLRGGANSPWYEGKSDLSDLFDTYLF